MTFSLNNFPRNDVKFKVALQWETEFLKIVQEFQKNSTTFDFAYMSEVKSNLAERYLSFSFSSPLIIFPLSCACLTAFAGGRNQPDNDGGHPHFHDQLRCHLSLHCRGPRRIHFNKTHLGKIAIVSNAVFVLDINDSLFFLQVIQS